jgi:hypothetical protein
MPMLIRLVLCLIAVAAVAAEEKKPAEGTEAPVLASAQPLALGAGLTNKITVRGKNLSELQKVSLAGSSALPNWKLLSKPEAKTDKPSDKKKDSPDQELEVEFKLPVDAPLGTNLTLMASNSKGDSKPLTFYVVAEGKLVHEKEPNDGFKAAQPVELGCTVAGSLQSATDVDVFKVDAKAGQKLRFEVIASQLGSAMDGSLTLYDSKGFILASNDDNAGSDPAITHTVAVDGACFIALTCVNELPGKMAAPYALKIGIEP